MSGYQEVTVRQVFGRIPQGVNLADWVPLIYLEGGLHDGEVVNQSDWGMRHTTTPGQDAPSVTVTYVDVHILGKLPDGRIVRVLRAPGSYGTSIVRELLSEIGLARAAEAYTKRFLELGDGRLIHSGRRYARPGKPGIGEMESALRVLVWMADQNPPMPFPPMLTRVIDRLATIIDADEKAAAADARRE